jgi:hypothetical protein
MRQRDWTIARIDQSDRPVDRELEISAKKPKDDAKSRDAFRKKPRYRRD